MLCNLAMIWLFQLVWRLDILGDGTNSDGKAGSKIF